MLVRGAQLSVGAEMQQLQIINFSASIEEEPSRKHCDCQREVLLRSARSGKGHLVSSN